MAQPSSNSAPPSPSTAQPAPTATTHLAPRTSHPPSTPQTLLPDLQAKWGTLARAALTDGQSVLATGLSDSTPVALANGVLTVEMPEVMGAQLAADPDLAKRLDELVSRIAGCPLRITARTRSGQGSGAVDDRSRRYRAAQDHPLMKALLLNFEADIVAREMIGHNEWLAGFGKKKVRLEQEPEA